MKLRGRNAADGPVGMHVEMGFSEAIGFVSLVFVTEESAARHVWGFVDSKAGTADGEVFVSGVELQFEEHAQEQLSVASYESSSPLAHGKAAAQLVFSLSLEALLPPDFYRRS